MFEHALEETTKKRGPDDKPIRVEDAILALEISTLYQEREFAGIEIDPSEHFTPDPPTLTTPLADPGAGLEHLLESAT